MSEPTRSVPAARASVRMLRGRHLIGFECVGCGPVEHDTALQIGEVLVCHGCYLAAQFGGDFRAEADDCPKCWPQRCPADGTVLRDGADHRAHLKSAHREG